MSKSISSLQEFIDEILRIRKLHNNTLWFRGEANVHPNVLPSLFRENNDKQIDFIVSERTLIDKALQYYPDLFRNCKNTIDKLVVMQHYQLPTRMLDVTRNPLVALYMACSKRSKEGEGGRVIYAKMEPAHRKLLDTLAVLIDRMSEDAENYNSSYNMKMLQGIWNQTYYKPIDLNALNDIFREMTKPQLLIPEYSNDRIKHQQGAVIFSALFSVDGSGFKERYDKIIGAYPKLASIEDMASVEFKKNAAPLDDWFRGNEIRISDECKDSILKELDVLGINEGFLFPEPEHQMKYVKWYCTTYK